MEALQLRDFIGSTLVIKLSESRTIKGTFVAIDADSNLLLDHVSERVIEDDDPTSVNIRSLGLLSVPRPTIQSIKIDKARLDLLSTMRSDFLQNIV